MTADRRSINNALVTFNVDFTEDQIRARGVINDNIITILTGKPGSSKSLVACSVAVELLKHKAKTSKFKHELDYSQINKIFLIRPTVQAHGTEDVGALPGDAFSLKSGKLAPFLTPLVANIKKLVSQQVFEEWVEKEFIEVVPVQFVRGRTFENCTAIVDEAQNMTMEQLQLIVSRLGHNAKIIMTSDIAQSDLKHVNQSAALYMNIMLKYEGVATYELTDNFRHPLAQQLHDEFVSHKRAYKQNGVHVAVI